jgi:hypothetical protein
MAEDGGLSSEFAYIGGMLSRNSRGRPINAPAAFHSSVPSYGHCRAAEGSRLGARVEA